MGSARNFEAAFRTGKNLPSTVWTDSQNLSGFCQSRNTIESVRGGEHMIRYFATYKKNRRLMKYFFGLKKLVV